MSKAGKQARTFVQRFLKVVGVTAGGAAFISAGGDRVFAHQFLAEAATLAIPEMEYSPELQLMVRPGSDEPVFGYSRSRLQGEGEYQVAPLVIKHASHVRTSSSCAVTAGGGANGSGPRSDRDSDTAQD
jgi:hypothetical protein